VLLELAKPVAYVPDANPVSYAVRAIIICQGSTS